MLLPGRERPRQLRRLAPVDDRENRATAVADQMDEPGRGEERVQGRNGADVARRLVADQILSLRAAVEVEEAGDEARIRQSPAAVHQGVELVAAEPELGEAGKGEEPLDQLLGDKALGCHA